jgi:hypothetical protein
MFDEMNIGIGDRVELLLDGQVATESDSCVGRYRDPAKL